MLRSARGLLHRLAHPEGEPEVKLLRKDVRRLTSRVEELTAFQQDAVERLRRADQTAAQLKLVSVLNRRQQDEIARIPELLQDQRIADHVRRAIATAPMLTDPYEHIVVQDVLPDDVYALLMRAIPPVEFFDNRDPIKQNLTFPI